MRARILIVAMLAFAAVVGAAIYWLQVYAFYREVEADAVELTLADGTTEVLPAQGFRGIDSSSSPIRYRACFALPSGDASRFRPYEGATPLNAPRWFDCFDARAIDEALEAGEARAVLAESTGVPGIDRVVALFPDGRAFAWHQIDPCGPLVDEDERPRTCPPLPAAEPTPVAPPPAQPVPE